MFKKLQLSTLERILSLMKSLLRKCYCLVELVALTVQRTMCSVNMKCTQFVARVLSFGNIKMNNTNSFSLCHPISYTLITALGQAMATQLNSMCMADLAYFIILLTKEHTNRDSKNKIKIRALHCNTKIVNYFYSFVLFAIYNSKGRAICFYLLSSPFPDPAQPQPSQTQLKGLIRYKGTGADTKI